MTSKDAIDKIKNLIKFGTVEAKFEQAKLADGTIIQWEDELGEGTAIMVVGEDGNVMPAPDATHTLEDGTMVTTVGGLVTKIEAKEAEIEEMAKQLKELKEKFADGATVDIASLSIMVKALMNYAYGWEMQESSRRQVVDEAVAVYKESFAKIILDNETLLTKVNEYEQKFTALTETITNTENSVIEKFAKVIELVEAISSEPATIVEAPKNITYKKIPNKQSAIEIFKEYQNKLNK